MTETKPETLSVDRLGILLKRIGIDRAMAYAAGVSDWEQIHHLTADEADLLVAAAHKGIEAQASEDALMERMRAKFPRPSPPQEQVDEDPIAELHGGIIQHVTPVEPTDIDGLIPNWHEVRCCIGDAIVDAEEAGAPRAKAAMLRIERDGYAVVNAAALATLTKERDRLVEQQYEVCEPLQDEIAKLKEERDALREALKPFAAVGEAIHHSEPNHRPLVMDSGLPETTVGDFRRAAVLSQSEG